MTAVELFELAVACYAREMDDAEWETWRRRVRPPQPQEEWKRASEALSNRAGEIREALNRQTSEEVAP